MITVAPFTGFGDNPSTSVKFLIRKVGGLTRDWEGGPRLVERKIPGGNRVNVRSTGRDPYTVEFEIRVDSLTEFTRLDAMQGQAATLRYPYGVTRLVGGRHEHLGNDDYLAIPGVRLMSLRDVTVRNHGIVHATARFMVEAP